jgi:hypothetical protein
VAERSHLASPISEDKTPADARWFEAASNF